MRPPTESGLRSIEIPDDVGPRTVGLYGGFTVAAATLVAGGMLAVGAADPGLGRRATALALLAVPPCAFLFAALVNDAPLRVSGALDPTPGVVEAWTVLAVGVAALAYVFGPVVGLSIGDGTVLLAPLALAAYLLAPTWLAGRVVDGLSPASDVAMATVMLSVLAAAGGAALTATGGAAGGRLYAGLGGAGVAVLTCLAATGGDAGTPDGD